MRSNSKKPSMPGMGMNREAAGKGMPPASMNETGAEQAAYEATDKPQPKGSAMPDGMNKPAKGGAMPGGMEGSESKSGSMPGKTERVLVELRVSRARAGDPAGVMQAAGLGGSSFQVDPDYKPVPVSPRAQNGGHARAAAPDEYTVIVRGTIEPGMRAELESQPNVVSVYSDGPIAPMGGMLLEESRPLVAPMEGFATCPIGVCDCSPSTPKGAIADVAAYLGADAIWASGYKGDGIVVGVVDGGITAQGRSISSDDTGDSQWPNKLVARVIGGFPSADWGTTGVEWDWHGNMCSTDVLGMAPNAQVYDIRISGGGGAISNALAGFQWAIDQHRADGTPQVLTNSWGIFQESWDPAYATDPNHPFTRKVVEALDEGILVLFAAGNCGATCPDGRCGSDTGPGRSIWGANSHPRVITVGAVNKDEQFVGYSSQGPGALDPNKPDFCSITHFTGFFNSDSGTSAATPIAAGVVALLKQASPAATQDLVKSALKITAKDIGDAGFDQHSGAGIIGAKRAFDSLVSAPRQSSSPVVAWGANRLDAFVLGTDRGLYHKWWDGAGWGPSVTGYEAMGGVCTSTPQVVAWAPNRLDVFVTGTDSALYHKWWDGASWGPSVTDYEYLGGVCVGTPRIVSWGPNRLDAFVLGTDRALYHKWWDGASWGPSVTDYEYMGGVCLGQPEVVSWGPNRLDVFVIGTDRALYHKWWDGTSWGPSPTGYERLGGVCMFPPRVVAWGPNRLDVFVIGTDGALYHKWWDGAAWGPSPDGFEYMGGVCAEMPEVVAWAPNRLDVFVIGTDSALYHKWWDGASWGPSVTGYEYMGGACTSMPRVTAWGSNRLDVFVTGTDSALYHKWWDGAAWGPSVTDYEPLGGTIVDF